MPATLADIQAKYGDSVYPLYKDETHAPYMENLNGEGYQGVLMYDESEDKVQCAVCGGWFKSLAIHINFKHKIDVNEYKDGFGLTRKIPLQSVGLSKKRSEVATKSNAIRHIPHYEKQGCGRIKESYQTKGVHGNQKVSVKNKHGLCDAQIIARLEVVMDITGKDKISSSDLLKYDKKLYAVLRTRYGNIKIAAKVWKFDSPHTSNHNRYKDSQMIAEMRKFVVKNKRMPSDRNGDLSFVRNTICDHFGSWSRAKMMAGLDQLLKEVK